MATNESKALQLVNWIVDSAIDGVPPLSSASNLAQFTTLPADSPGVQWITDAIEELEHIGDEVAEDALSEIHADTRKHARRMILALENQPIAPTVYPTTDGEIALYFKSPVAASSVLILVGNDGQAACFSYINGKNRRAQYDDAADLLDAFVKAQVRALQEVAFGE